MVGLPILGPAMLAICSTWASAIAYMATLIASATALVIASLIMCSVVIVSFILLVLFYFYCCYYLFTPDAMLWYCVLLWW